MKPNSPTLDPDSRLASSARLSDTGQVIGTLREHAGANIRGNAQSDRHRCPRIAIRWVLEEEKYVLYDMTSGSLTEVPKTTFAAEAILERKHLQAAVRDRIEVLGSNLLVVAEEFGEFEDTHRRIDLLCIDKSGRLVVVELKRTEAGGHMELQALRYAAMVSVMTFDELVITYARHLNAVGDPEHDSEVARTRLIDWLEETDEEEPVLSREVGIVLASANFSQEITTTVLWLNEFYGTDIRCIRLSPYRHQDRLLLDVQQVIPLPEAEELTVRLKKREAAAKEAKISSKDYTKFVVVTPKGSSEPRPKRWAMLELVTAIHDAGVPATTIASAMPTAKFKSVPGELSGRQLWSALREHYAFRADQDRRWHLDNPIHETGTTWVVSNQWGSATTKWFEQLLAIAPSGVHVYPANQGTEPADEGDDE